MNAASSALPQQHEEARHHEQAVASDRHAPTVSDPADHDEQRGNFGFWVSLSETTTPCKCGLNAGGECADDSGSVAWGPKHTLTPTPPGAGCDLSENPTTTRACPFIGRGSSGAAVAAGGQRVMSGA